MNLAAQTFTALRQQLCGPNAKPITSSDLPSSVGRKTTSLIRSNPLEITTPADSISGAVKSNVRGSSLACPRVLKFIVPKSNRPGIEIELSAQYSVLAAAQFSAISPALSRHLIRNADLSARRISQSSDRSRVLKKLRRGTCSSCAGVLVPGISCVTEIKEFRSGQQKRVRLRDKAALRSNLHTELVTSEIKTTCNCGERTMSIGSKKEVARTNNKSQKRSQGHSDPSKGSSDQSGHIIGRHAMESVIGEKKRSRDFITQPIIHRRLSKIRSNDQAAVLEVPFETTLFDVESGSIDLTRKKRKKKNCSIQEAPSHLESSSNKRAVLTSSHPTTSQRGPSERVFANRSKNSQAMSNPNLNQNILPSKRALLMLEEFF